MKFVSFVSLMLLFGAQAASALKALDESSSNAASRNLAKKSDRYGYGNAFDSSSSDSSDEDIDTPVLDDEPMTVGGSGATPPYWEIGENIKCPKGKQQGRLFKINNAKNGVEECYKKCYETESCLIFSLGMYEGKLNCIGCTGHTMDTLEAHDGFTAYELTPDPKFPALQVVEPPSMVGGPGSTPPLDNDPQMVGSNPPFSEIAADKKCPNNDKLFKINKVDNVYECYEECDKTEGCTQFSVGINKKNLRCVGCKEQTLETLDSKKGYTAYELKPKSAIATVAVPSESSSPSSKKEKTDKKDKDQAGAIEKAQKNKNKGGRCKATGWGDPQ